MTKTGIQVLSETDDSDQQWNSNEFRRYSITSQLPQPSTDFLEFRYVTPQS